jgi:IclR family pca regulon transcriptional regulator
MNTIERSAISRPLVLAGMLPALAAVFLWGSNAVIARHLALEGVSMSVVAFLRVVVARVDSTHVIQVSHATIEHLPFFSRATGRALAAFATDEELEQVIARHGMPGSQWDNIEDMPSLRAALAAVRQAGICKADTPEYELIGLSCPVAGSDGKAWGVLGLYAPAFRCTPETIRNFAKKMQRCAADLSGALASQ